MKSKILKSSGDGEELRYSGFADSLRHLGQYTLVRADVRVFKLSSNIFSRIDVAEFSGCVSVDEIL